MRSLLFVAVALVACSPNPDPPKEDPAPPVVAEGTPLDVPSDPQARYYVLERGGTAKRPTIVTKRVGPSGTTYSQREVDCVARIYRYLGTGDTRAAMSASPPEPNMGPLTDESISDYVARAACNAP